MIETKRAAERRRPRRATRSASRCGSRSPRSSRTTRAIPYKPPIPLTVIVNPVIEPLDDELVAINEGCLSVPGPARRARRATSRSGVALPRPRRDRARRGQARADRRHLPARGRPPRRRALPRPVADPRTLTTWEQFERFHREEFVRARSRSSSSGSRRVSSVLVRARLARRRASRGRGAGRGRGRARSRRSRPASRRRPPARRGSTG